MLHLLLTFILHWNFPSNLENVPFFLCRCPFPFRRCFYQLQFICFNSLYRCGTHILFFFSIFQVQTDSFVSTCMRPFAQIHLAYIVIGQKNGKVTNNRIKITMNFDKCPNEQQINLIQKDGIFPGIERTKVAHAHAHTSNINCFVFLMLTYSLINV